MILTKLEVLLAGKHNRSSNGRPLKAKNVGIREIFKDY